MTETQTLKTLQLFYAGAPSPCAISCVNPFTGLAKALPEPRRLEVRETLWDGGACVFELTAP